MKLLNNRAKTAVLAAVIALSLLTGVFCANAAQPQPAFTVSEVTAARPGDEISVTVNANANRGFCAGEFTLSYDSSVLTPQSIESGDAAGQYFVGNKDYAAGEVFFAMIDENLISQEGTLATITFKVSEQVLLYSGEISLNVGALVGNISVGYGLNDVTSTAYNGAVYAAKLITVPDVDVPDENETLTLNGSEQSGFVLSGRKIGNLITEKIAANFDTSLTPTFYDSSLNLLNAQQALTTGCVIKLFEGETLKQTLTVSAKGDVNGDYAVDAFDAFLAGMVQSGLLTSGNIGAAAENAADLDSDGTVGEDDFEALEQSGLNP